MIGLLLGVENEMCSLQVANLTAVLLQVKTFALYQRYYDQDVLPRVVQMLFQGFGNEVLTLEICFYRVAVLIPTLTALNHSVPVSSMWPVGPLVGI